MKTEVSLAMVILLFLFASFLPVYADSISGPAGTAYYYYDGTYGTLDPSSAVKCTMTVTNVDVSLLTSVFHFLAQDRGGGSGWEAVYIQVHKDFYGAGGHLFQSGEFHSGTGWAWVVRSSHGFNPGDVPGTFDLRITIEDRGTYYHVTPQFRLPTGSWTTFFDGEWDTLDFEFSKTCLVMQIDGGSAGTVTFDAPIAACISPVGGIWVPLNTFDLLAPWITLASLITVAAVSIIYVKRRKKQQN